MASKPSTFAVRPMDDADADALGGIFFRAVHEGTAAQYSQTQRAAWVKAPPSGPAWKARLRQADCILAESAKTPVGFMSSKAGHIDMAFVAPDMAGQGVARLLYAVLEGRARTNGVTTMTTEASLTAEPFFARQGFQVIERQEVVRHGVTLQNCRMEKRLSLQ